MARARIAAKVDKNQKELKEAFERLGCEVVSLARLGQGLHDLLVGIPDCGPQRTGVNVLVEVKGPDGELTADQVKFHARWPGPQAVAVTVEDVVRIFEQYRGG